MVFKSKPKLREPFLIACLPGMGGVGESVAKHLIQMLDAELFAEIISPKLPDYVIVKDGICRLPTYAFYATNKVKPNLVILTGDAQPHEEDVVGHYELSEEVVKLAKRLKVRAVIGVGGFMMPDVSEGVFVAFSSEELGRRFLEAGAKLMPKGHIIGAAGLIPAMAAEAGMESTCLLSVVSSPLGDRDASARLLKVLLKGLGLSLRPAS